MHDYHGKGDDVQLRDVEWIIVCRVGNTNTDAKWGIYMFDDTEPHIFDNYNDAEVIVETLSTMLHNIGMNVDCYIVRSNYDDGAFRPVG